MENRFAHDLKHWRKLRRLSQLHLGMAANVSSRHIAFLETGRASPTRSMVLKLADTLDVPRPQRNQLLEAAGFSAAYVSRDLTSHEMASFKTAVDRMLERHAPYPGFAFDRHWTLFAVNRPAERMLSSAGVGVGQSLLTILANPEFLQAAVENWQEVAQHLCARLRTESRHVGGDKELDAAAERMEAAIGNSPEQRHVLPAIMTTRYRFGESTLSFFSTIAQFSSAEDILLADLKIELLFPVDEFTRHALESQSPL